MPCKDTTSKITVILDKNDLLINFEFSKITCNKEIGGGTGYLEYCKNKSADEIVQVEFEEPLQILKPKSTEDQFFLYMEWDALRTCLAQFVGSEIDVDLKQYRIASIDSNKSSTSIIQFMSPPEKMPKIIPCIKRANAIK